MKNVVYLLISFLLALSLNLQARVSGRSGQLDLGDSIRVIASPDLYNLTTEWAAEYNRLYPGSDIKVIKAGDSQRTGNLIKGDNIGFVSNIWYEGLKNESLWKIVVARDIIVPVINAKNPFLDEIEEHGVSSAVLASFLDKGSSATWGDLVTNGKNEKADYFCVKDESAVSSIAGFLKTDESIIKGRNMADAPALISAIQNDRYSIGFCKLVNVLDIKTMTMVENLKLLPVDRNGNGLIDNNEKIYDDVNSFTRGVWIGKYPKALFSNIYTVSEAQPENTKEIAFIKWVISDGQKYLSGNGYSDLLASERQSAADNLNNARLYAGASTGEKNLLKSLMFVITTVILIGLIANSAAKYRKRKKATVKMTGPAVHSILDQNSLVIPGGIYFDKTHTWAFLEQNGNVVVGIDDFLQHITGKITRIKMKDPGKKVIKGDQILSIIQNGKQLNLYAPVSGTIVEQNLALEDNSSALNSSPYRDGWIYRIEPSNWARESQLLFMADKQKEFIKKEFSRLKDFLMTALSGDPKYSQLLLQDGGEISDGVMGEMGPEVWEDFQTSFIDPSRQVWFYEIF